MRLIEDAHLFLQVLVQLVLFELLSGGEFEVLLLVDRVHVRLVVFVEQAELAVLLVFDLLQLLPHLIFGRGEEDLFTVGLVLLVLRVVLVFVKLANLGLLLLESRKNTNRSKL